MQSNGLTLQDAEQDNIGVNMFSTAGCVILEFYLQPERGRHV